MFGCCLGLPDATTAITFVALGTSLPDTFASVEATQSDETADASIGNVTGSNSVNVFLGLGLPWTMAAVYWSSVGVTEDWKKQIPLHLQEMYPGGAFIVPAGDLSFSVTVFSVCALVCIAFLVARRKLA